MINKFENFQIEFKEHPTIDNYFRYNITVNDKDGKFVTTLVAHYFSLCCAELLTSDKIEDVRNGFKIYKESVEYWLEQAKSTIL